MILASSSGVIFFAEASNEVALFLYNWDDRHCMQQKDMF